MKKALFFEKKNGVIECKLCPNGCKFKEDGRIGGCLSYIRKNGELYSRNYGIISSFNVDPIEKKPLFHFYPGKKIASVGTYGCNLHCKFCQNYEISQKFGNGLKTTPEEFAYKIKKLANWDKNVIGLAFTYNEPFIWFEFVYDTAKIIDEYGLKNVMVTNGYVNEEPLKKILPFIHAFNVDLKAFNDDFYKKLCGGSLENVLNTLEIIAESGKHLEITYLLITGENDDEKEFEKAVEFIEKLNKNIPLHISRYYPTYKMNNEATSLKKMEKFFEIAQSKLNYVYLGNVGTNENTYCPHCKNLIVERKFYNINRYDNNGKCGDCGFDVFKEV